MKTAIAYIGTYTSAKSRGIYSLELDIGAGELTNIELAAEATDPSFLALHPSGRYLYAVAESSGSVCSFEILSNKKLKSLNEQSSSGKWPCHLIVNRKGNYLFVANYGSGNASMLPIEANGSLSPVSQTVKHHGSGPNPARQEAPHAHSINLDPSEQFAFVADLGIDKIMAYRFDSRAGKLSPHTSSSASATSGAGPRHMAFHPTGKFAYVINELASTVTAFHYESHLGVLREAQTISSLPVEYTGSNTAAEVRVHPSGRFLYASNRGHDSIAMFSIDPYSGNLTNIGYEPTLGKTPRHFAIDPTGTWLLAANQNSDSLVIFRIDSQTGKLEFANSSKNMSSPVCVIFKNELR